MILVVDDEPGIRESLVYALERDGFQTSQAATLAEARERLAGAALLVLDLMLPDGRGLDLLQEIRRDLNMNIPVIILTSRDEEADRVVGLEVGADDYVTKPFSPREVVARVHAVLRRASPAPALSDQDSPVVGPHGLRVDPSRRRAWAGTVELALSKIEFDLLSVFLGAPGLVFERGQLLNRVWGDDAVVSDRTVDVHLKALRKKVSAAGVTATVIETVRGVGYRLSEEKP